MKALDNFLNKIGIDKALHFFVGFFICTCMTMVMILQEGDVSPIIIATPIGGTVLTGILAWAKEMSFDDTFDKKDIIASLLGCIPVYILVAIGVLFNYLSH